MNASGRCLCGAVSFTAVGVDEGIHVCHCSLCRRWCGGPSFAARVGKVDLAGMENIGTFASSAWGERGFCIRCGSGLFFRAYQTGEYYLNFGLFDDPSRFHVADEIFIEDKPPGYGLVGHHPRLTGAEFQASLQEALATPVNRETGSSRKPPQE